MVPEVASVGVRERGESRVRGGESGERDEEGEGGGVG